MSATGRISHRSSNGPDLNYLYASEQYDADDTPIPIYRSRKSKTQKRGRKSDNRTLRGTTLYLGGEEANNEKIYCIPGHAERVLCIDTKTDDVYPIGPIFNASNMILGGKYKWLRGIVIGDIIYGLPCHADCVLRIDSATDEVSVIDIPYEKYFDSVKGEGQESAAHQERHRGWKYHGGAISPHDGCIYAIPQSAQCVLRVDPRSETCSFIGPKFAGRCKWYGGVIGNSDGAIYAIPQNAQGVLRIDASGVNHVSSGTLESKVLVTTHGEFEIGMHKWHGAAASADGTIVSVPANADNVLCIVPAKKAAYPIDGETKENMPEPELYILEGESKGDIATGRHRSDGKYKYLGAMAGTDGHVYCFPSGSERVLQVDTANRIAKSVGPNLRDKGMEVMHQNKWQNGLTTYQEGCVYAIPLAGETVLRIRTGNTDKNTGGSDDVEVTTWKLPEPNKVLEKWEGGVLAKNGVMYCMPNNHKAVLQIVPACLPSRDKLAEEREGRRIQFEKEREARALEKEEAIKRKQAEKEAKRLERKNKSPSVANGSRSKVQTSNDSKSVPNKATRTDDGVPFKYTSGIATLRSSAHRVKYSLEHRKHDPNPIVNGKSTNSTFLPSDLCREDILSYNTKAYNFHDAVVRMLLNCDRELVGTFRTLNGCSDVGPYTLDNFAVPTKSLTRKCQKGCLELAQKYLSDQVQANAEFLSLFDSFLENIIVPHLKQRLVSTGAVNTDAPITFYYQRPPTLRIQPGPARAFVKAHDDAEYGHQNGELNFWLPLTNRRKTGVDLYCESSSKKGDYHRVMAEFGEVASFHGSSCRHYVNANHSLWTRVSLDFRVGVEGYFDPNWQMIGTTDDHSRSKVIF